MGYAHTLGKNCLLITGKANDIPFDLKHHRHIVYDSSITKLKGEPARDIALLKSEVSEKKGPFRIELANIYGFLHMEETKDWLDNNRKNYYAYGDVYFRLRVYNDSDRPSSEIDDMYIYTGKGWDLTQDKTACIAMDSDISTYARRYVMRCPHKRVTKGSWIEVSFQGRKLLEHSKEEIVKDAYNLKGNLTVRINTVDETYDMKIPLLVECSDIPF